MDISKYLSPKASSIITRMGSPEDWSSLDTRLSSFALDSDNVRLKTFECYLIDNEAMLLNLKPIAEIRFNQKFNFHNLSFHVECDGSRVVYWGDILKDGRVLDDNPFDSLSCVASLSCSGGMRFSFSKYIPPKYIIATWELDGTIIGDRDPKIFNLKID